MLLRGHRAAAYEHSPVCNAEAHLHTSQYHFKDTLTHTASRQCVTHTVVHFAYFYICLLLSFAYISFFFRA